MAREQHLPGLARLLGSLVRTAAGAFRNRVELFAVEWQEERARLVGLFAWSMGLVFLGILGVLLFTAVIIFLFREDLRIYVAAGFTVLYLAGALVVLLVLRSMLKREPFAESLAQARKDTAWLDSLR